MNRAGKTLLVLALVVVVGMAFRVSWNALRDVATAVGADATGATLYPFVVDGLMALALVATLVLTDRADKRFALRVLAAYTAASLVLNFVHGLVPELHGESVDWTRLADWDPVNWLLVLLATSLPVGSIYFGSDLVAKVLHHRPAPISAPTANAEESTETVRNQSRADLVGSTPEAITPNVKPLPRAVAVGFLKSTLPAKSLPAIQSSPVQPIELGAVAAESTRPRRTTGRVPEAARTPRPKRTPDELLDEARKATADWPDDKLTAEGIRRTVRTSPVNARMLRDTLLAERATVGAVA
ncbi:DUF2637 domain-containing protein [Streptomyces sp. FIT100]|uniref:DUF2637 domain-containing protein n=1 Tax=Streptomyces sp. FIT100 TaxID=2837956 RepID=UPI0021CA497E|nr:DUF2637 domain-containing protein [Streptomyces sp. FIT100]UUN27792.1 DUF2637 domain-containing protein [Streptomyces sp. FIT100]